MKVGVNGIAMHPSSGGQASPGSPPSPSPLSITHILWLASTERVFGGSKAGILECGASAPLSKAAVNRRTP